MKPSDRYAFPKNGFCNGLTKREWFAGMALQGMMANHSEKLFAEIARSKENGLDYVATLSYKIADAMLNERNQKE